MSLVLHLLAQVLDFLLHVEQHRLIGSLLLSMLVLQVVQSMSELIFLVLYFIQLVFELLVLVIYLKCEHLWLRINGFSSTLP